MRRAGGSMKNTAKILASLMVLLLLLLNSAFAGDAIPRCLSKGKELQLDNAYALRFRNSETNQSSTRARIQGRVSRVFPDRNGHEHFEIQIGPNAQDIVEVVYNQEFGEMPNPAIGQQVEACGDFIVSNAPTVQYPASPSGAIIHWVHMNPRSGHDSGYVVIDGRLYGQKKPVFDRNFASSYILMQ